MSDHWIYVFQDIWWAMRWVIPPAFFLAAGAAFGYDNDAYEVTAILLLIGYISYICAMNGWWL